jgi:hypothetical protein
MRVLEQNGNQDIGEPFAQPTGVELPPATRADLLDPALWPWQVSRKIPLHSFSRTG